jgi:hypothetical protein
MLCNYALCKRQGEGRGGKNLQHKSRINFLQFRLAPEALIYNELNTGCHPSRNRQVVFHKPAGYSV